MAMQKRKINGVPKETTKVYKRACFRSSEEHLVYILGMQWCPAVKILSSLIFLNFCFWREV